MNHTENPLYWSVPVGNLFQTRVRLSVYFALLPMVLWFSLDNGRLAFWFSIVLLVSALIHELGHVFAARLGGGDADEILIWPLGGLATVHPAPTVQAQVVTALAGPFANLIVCLLTLYPVRQAGYSWSILNPVVLPAVDLQRELWMGLLVLTFSANWLMLVINLAPVFPLDGGRVLQSCLMSRFGGETALMFSLRIGFLVAAIAMVIGLSASMAWVVFLGAIVLVMNLQEMQQIRSGEAYEDSFMGYDFSQGYTSLEKSDPTIVERRPSMLQRWREKRRRERLQREQEDAAELARQIDAILEKVHESGMESLSDAERRTLNRASAHLRQKEQGHD